MSEYDENLFNLQMVNQQPVMVDVVTGEVIPVDPAQTILADMDKLLQQGIDQANDKQGSK